MRFLLRVLVIASVNQALAVVTEFFDQAQLPPKAHLVLEELPGR